MEINKSYRKLIRMVIISILVLTGFTFIHAQRAWDYEELHGKVVFANTSIDEQTIAKGDLKEKFNVDEPIYAGIFLDKPLSEYFADYDWKYNFEDARFKFNFAMVIYIDGRQVIQWLNQLSPDWFKRATYIEVPIVPGASEKYQHSISVSDWLNSVRGLTEGTHKVRVEFVATTIDHEIGEEPPISKGSFTLSVTPQGLQSMEKTFAIGLPDATIIDPKVEQGIINASRDLYPGLVPVKAVIIEPTGEWQYRRDMNGDVLTRMFTAVVAYQGFEDECHVKTALYMQKHKGYNEWDNVMFSKELDNYYDYEIPCSTLGKLLNK